MYWQYSSSSSSSSDASMVQLQLAPSKLDRTFWTSSRSAGMQHKLQSVPNFLDDDYRNIIRMSLHNLLPRLQMFPLLLQLQLQLLPIPPYFRNSGPKFPCPPHRRSILLHRPSRN